MRTRSTLGWTALVALLTAILLFPLYWMLVTALVPTAQVLSRDPALVPALSDMSLRAVGDDRWLRTLDGVRVHRRAACAARARRVRDLSGHPDLVGFCLCAHADQRSGALDRHDGSRIVHRRARDRLAGADGCRRADN